MEFRILGPLEVSAGDGPLKVGGLKQRAVLLHLILMANRPVPVERLIDGLWGEEPPEAAKNTLQTYVYRLRRLLGEDRIASKVGDTSCTPRRRRSTRPGSRRWCRRPKPRCRPTRRRPRRHSRRRSGSGATRPCRTCRTSPRCAATSPAWRSCTFSATEHRIAAEIAMGGHSTVVSELEALTARYPLRERMWANLMLALYRLGRQTEAVAVYQRAREVLADELGAEPSQELQRLNEQILRRDPSLGTRETPKRTIKHSRVDLQPGAEFAGYRIVSTLGARRHGRGLPGRA